MRIMAVDYGKKRVGVAITDPLGTMSLPLSTIAPKSDSDLIERLKCIIDENEVGLVIVGNPLSLKGAPTEMSNTVERFVKKMKRRIDVEVVLWDERYISQLAVNRFKDLGMSSKKEDIDRVAASIILDEYLESKRV